MFKHILVPTDLTDRDRKSMEIAIKMALGKAGKITILHVVETIENTETEDFHKFYKQLGIRATKKMDLIVDQYRQSEVVIEKQVLFGRRVYEILNFAGNSDTDLIIMSSHRLDIENASEGWGTISFKVGVLSHCPVLLVK
ncbi:MAG: universal stress protein [Syntrophobacteraceae bacterium]